MSLDHLWAGWRSSYVSSAFGGSGDGADVPDSAAGVGAPAPSADPGGPDDCVFCTIFSLDAPDEERHVVWESERVVVVLNAFPYASGHVLVMPRRHLGELDDLDADESAELWEATRRAATALRRAYAPDGVNLGANLGRAAGAGIPRHVHLHALPRWVGDTNFMTTVASARVLPEALPVSWAKLRAAWSQAARPE